MGMKPVAVSLVVWSAVVTAYAGPDGIKLDLNLDDRSIVVRPQVIYGEDNRKDLYEIQNDRILESADSTAALFSNSQVTIDPASGYARLATQPYGASYNLCREEPFYDQSVGARCTGFLVGHDLMATAGHCIDDQGQCDNTRFVFGFAIRQEGQAFDRVPASDVYDCQEIVDRVQNGSGPDWEVVRLKRSVANHKPLEINRTGSVHKGAPLVVIGHPSGLPTKVADGARVREVMPNGYFLANLDTYHGNSGSPVFNEETGLVEGILVRGEDDYVMKEGEACMVSKRCPDDGCSGEGVTLISQAAAKIPIGGNMMLFASRVSRPGEAMSSLLENAGETTAAAAQSR